MKYKKTRAIQFSLETEYLSFAKNVSNLSGKYSQKGLDYAKQSAIDALKTVSKRAIQKTVEATGDFIGDKIANKVTKSQEIHGRIIQRQLKVKQRVFSNIGFDRETPRQRYISPEKRQLLMV